MLSVNHLSLMSMVDRRRALSLAAVVRSWSVVSTRSPGALVIANPGGRVRSALGASPDHIAARSGPTLLVVLGLAVGLTCPMALSDVYGAHARRPRRGHRDASPARERRAYAFDGATQRQTAAWPVLWERSRGPIGEYPTGCGLGNPARRTRSKLDKLLFIERESSTARHLSRHTPVSRSLPSLCVAGGLLRCQPGARAHLVPADSRRLLVQAAPRVR